MAWRDFANVLIFCVFQAALARNGPLEAQNSALYPKLRSLGRGRNLAKIATNLKDIFLLGPKVVRSTYCGRVHYFAFQSWVYFPFCCFRELQTFGIAPKVKKGLINKLGGALRASPIFVQFNEIP